MKIPSIRNNIGVWKYYISYLSFEQIDSMVKRVDDELHKSESLRDLIQRSITKNYEDIKDYILTQDERFFNALVLAVYDGEPKWIEVELNFKDEEFFNMGFLEFNGKEKIFPVDGQHRVEGIKAALKINNKLKNEKVAVLFIGHKKDKAGMEKSRRLFTTLNRYAKPVTWDDIIALDEDDSAAIVTRELLEDHPLFSGKRIIKAKQKAIPENDKTALTSIITLYQCNRELLKLFLKENKNKYKLSSFKRFLKYRPTQKFIDHYKKYTFNFWNDFAQNVSVIHDYLDDKDKEPAKNFRNKMVGGNLLFRPVGLLPFIQAVISIKKKQNNDYSKIFKGLNKLNLNLNSSPWEYVLWNSKENKMIMGSNEIVRLMLIYLFNKSILLPKEIKKLKEGYSVKIGYKGKTNVLDRIK